MRLLIFFGLILGLSLDTQAQIKPGLSVQIYPAGQIVQASARVWSNERSEATIFAGINRARRQDFGKKDNEEGLGGGIGIDIMRLTGTRPRGLYLGGKLDLWYLNIDWRQVENPCPKGAQCLAPVILRTGETRIFVVQPTVIAGYRLLPVGNSVTVDFSIALGVEINAYTDGDRVGEGVILLGGLALGF
ncbi:MAG: hypothetical protein BMS9Abin05_1767 [Rhodothermia bacterium]|nr:MAG: hypothetical protein BMS9Abin05_1767 [Rhodothermia bacterium]